MPRDQWAIDKSKRLVDKVARLDEFDPKVQTTLPFGKHRGRKITWVIRNDPQYIEWLLGTPESCGLRPNLRRSIELAKVR